jgi:rsbT co-antagonist protein RsbR
MGDPHIEHAAQRFQHLEETLANAAAGHFQKIEVRHDDPLAGIEMGVNIVLDDLNTELAKTAQANRELDETVLARTRELQEKLDHIIVQNELIRRQRDAIRELSTPVLQLWDDVIAMPIIGVVDTQRSIEIMQRLLESIRVGGARFAILDITGVDVVDTSTADHLTKIVRAAQLLGTECVLAGIQPVVALTLASLGVDMETTRAYRNLQQGLAACLRSKSQLS